MKEGFGKLIYTKTARVISAILCAVSATALGFLLVMLLLVRVGGYRGLSQEQMTGKAMDRISKNNMIYLMNELASIRGTGLGEFENAPDASSDIYKNYCRQVSEEYGKMKNVNFAVILSDKSRFEDLDETEIRSCFYKSPGYTGYTGVISGQSFATRYYPEDRPYHTLLEDDYWDQGIYYGYQSEAGQENYIYILYATADELTAEGSDRLDDLYLNQDLREFLGTLYEVDQKGIAMAILALISLAVGMILLCVSAGHSHGTEEIRLGLVDKIPLEIITGGVFLADVILAAFFVVQIKELSYLNGFGYQDMMILSWASSLAGMFLGFTLLATWVARIKAKTFWSNTILGRILRWLIRLVKRIGGWMAENTPLAGRVCILLPPIGIISLVEAALIEDASGFMAVLFVFGRLFVIAVALYLVWGYSRLREGADRIAAGKLDEPVKEAHLTPEYRRFAGKLNSVGESIQLAVEERMKSEHLKTQLITNVSHDIKTPLTSIINYVDLLQKEGVSEEERKEYLDVLSKQSDRLKKLIQDLIDASKASSGAVEVELTEIDLNTLAKQVLGEYQDKFEAAGLKAVSKISDSEMKVKVDSNLLWRVMDNLYTNVVKYAMPGTRVYVETAEKEGTIIFSITNISGSELGISEDELMERFVRGDASRNTEGSGLGLSIARSLMELMGGSLSIKVDGDLFKAILEMKQ